MEEKAKNAGAQAIPRALSANSVKFIHLPPVESKAGSVPDAAKFNAGENAELERIFNGLAEKWKRETEAYSLTYKRYAHPSYQAILALGNDVVPLILRELQLRPDRWFEALKAFNNNKDEALNAKSFDQTVRCWLEWGKQKNLIPQDDPT